MKQNLILKNQISLGNSEADLFVIEHLLQLEFVSQTN